MAIPIIPRWVRGSLYFNVADVLIATLAPAYTAWSRAKGNALDLADLSGGGQ